MKKLTVWIEDGLHKSLRMDAARADTTVSDLVRERLANGTPQPAQAASPAPVPKREATANTAVAKVTAPQAPKPIEFPPIAPKPVYEFTPATCPIAGTHNSLHVCPKCGADEA